MPPVLQVPMALSSTPVEELEVHFVIGEKGHDEEDPTLGLKDVIQRISSESLERGLDDLRLNGVSEEQIAAVLGAVRLECLLMLMDYDLMGVVADYVQSNGKTASLREVIAMILMPELSDLIAGLKDME